MRLYMKLDSFNWGTPLPLADRSGRTRYTLTGDAYSLGKRLHVTDLAGREAVYVHQKVPSLFPRYAIEVYGKPVAEIYKDLTFLRPRYTIEALDWEIMGTLGACDYEITWQSSVVAACRPLEDDSGQYLSMEFYDRTAELPALGVLLTVNCIFAAQEPKHL